jgi:alpha-L-fucosidase
VLYAIVLAWPEGGLNIESLGTHLKLRTEPVGHVELVGSSQPVIWSREPDGLKVTLPFPPPCRHAYVLKITR